MCCWIYLDLRLLCPDPFYIDPFDLYRIPPSTFQVLPRSSHEVSDLLRGNGFEETKGFLSSHEIRQIITQKVQEKV